METFLLALFSLFKAHIICNLSTYLLFAMDIQTFHLINFILAFLCAMSAMASPTTLLNNSTDKAALISFKFSITNSQSEALHSWNDTTDFCNWEGVSCSKKNKGRVVSVNLSSRGLAGYIPSSIGNLSFLHHLDLNQNQFSGTIPHSLFRLPRLHFLNLSNNSLNGEIPSNMSSSITTINLDRNYLAGSIPTSLSLLSKLTFISLSNNNLTGKIPPSIGNLSSLQHLDLSLNQLEGGMPKEIGNHQSLEYLRVSINKLSGELPTNIFNLSSTYFFSVVGNTFEGMIPTTFGNNLPNLKILLMSHNKFEGSIPNSLCNASKLNNIFMNFNSFNGIIPSELGRLRHLTSLNLAINQLEASDHNSWRFLDSLTNCSQLEMLFLDENKLKGTLPSSIASLSIRIRQLGISSNQIYGSIPSSVGNLTNLIILLLQPNNLIGAIPESIGKLARLQVLSLHRGMLTGTLPFSIGNLTQLFKFFLDFNGLNGPIPSSIGNLKNVQWLLLDKNNLSGNIPTEVFRLPSILFLGLAFNFLTGPIPSQIGDLKHIEELNLHENKLLGEIPNSISGCMNLEVLNLSSNLIQGTIPPSMGDLKGLITLDLSKNNLIGQIPKTLGTLKGVQFLNFSFNHLVGEVPSEGIFLNATAVSLQGNYGLCGGVLDLHLPACPHKNSFKKRRLPQLSLLTILLPCMVGISLIIFIIFYFNCRRTDLMKNSFNSNIIEDVYPKVSYAELEASTNGFSPINLLGVGQYGSVYKASLNNYGYTTVAVKVFNLQQQGASKAFSAECEALRCIKHRNLVKIITCCVGIDSKGDDFMAIVFEFMTNGNLDTWLHAKDYMMEHLELAKRLDIAIDIANAFCYLHNECETPIIHCDLKPSNVLLDDNMVAHVGDFGLASLFRRVVSISLRDTNQTSPMIRGTIGYTAPEYGLGNPISFMGDVYSYGILLIEMFTGRRPVDKIFKDDLNLHKFVEMAIPNRVLEVIDPKLQSQLQDIPNNDIQSRRTTYECLTSILKLSLLCSKEFARERICMVDAARELCSIRNVYFKVVLQSSGPQNEDDYKL